MGVFSGGPGRCKVHTTDGRAAWPIIEGTVCKSIYVGANNCDGWPWINKLLVIMTSKYNGKSGKPGVALVYFEATIRATISTISNKAATRAASRVIACLLEMICDYFGRFGCDLR